MPDTTDAYRALLDDAIEAIYVTDMDYNLLYTNKPAEKLSKVLFDRKESGNKCYQRLLGRDTPCPFCKMETMTRDHFTQRVFSGATGRVFELRGKLIDWNGTPAHIEYIRNITEKQAAQEKSRELAAQQQNLYDHMGVGLCLYRWKDGAMHSLLCNDEYRSLFALPKGFDEGAPIQLELRNFPENERDTLAAFMTEHLSRGIPFRRVCRIHDKTTNLPRSVLIHADCVRENDPQNDPKNDSILWYVTASDVTEWAEKETQLNNILPTLHGGIVVYRIAPGCTPETVMFTDGVAEMQGLTRQEYEAIATKDTIALVYPDDRERLLREIAAAAAASQPLNSNCRVIHKTKGHIWVNLNASPAGQDAHGFTRYNAVFTNVTKQFELYQNLLDISDTGLMVTDEATKELYFTNRSAQRLIAASHAHCGKDACPAQTDGVCSLCSASQLLPPPILTRRKLRLGAQTYQVSPHRIDWMGRPAVAQYFTDISEETALQSRLASDEERYRLVVEKSGISMADCNIQFRSLYISQDFRRYVSRQAPDFELVMQPLGIKNCATVCEDDLPTLERFVAELDRRNTALTRLRVLVQGRGYRWTEVGALRVFDETGTCLRKIVFVRDVDDAVRQYEDLKLRYDYELEHQGSFENGVVERMTLDLTDNKVTQAANPRSPSLTRVLGMSVEEMLALRLSRAADLDEEHAIRAFMNREKLLEAYYTGRTPMMEYPVRMPGREGKVYIQSTIQLRRDPRSGHIIGFMESRDNDRFRVETTLMQRLLETNYESAVVIHAESGTIKLGISTGQEGFETAQGQNYEELMRQDIAYHVPPDQQEEVLRQMSLAGLRAGLEQNKLCSGRVPHVENGEDSYRLWTAAYFDKEREYILLTISNVTEVYQRDLRNAQALQNALDQAKVASQAKSTFLARMSHEIRTPITTVSGILELMRQECTEGRGDRQLLQTRIETAAAANRYLLTLINDILDISKIENNTLTIRPEPTDIRTVIRPLVAMMKTTAEEKKIQMVLQRKTETANWYRMDAVRVSQILMNVLNNAVKFTPVGGTVYFTGEVCTVADNRATVRFAVRDTGVGVSEAFKPFVFEPFRQEYADAKTGYGGTGIGLSLSRSLARRMGGDITFASEKGRGSTFTVTLVLELAATPENAVLPGAEGGGTAAPGGQSAPGAGRDLPDLKGLRILVAEDNAINREIVQELLEHKGCLVTPAVDGQQALELFDAAPAGSFDLILMDIRMPKLDGLEATRAIRALAPTRPDAATVPIIAMSANAYEEDRQLSLAAGMNEHLSKPVGLQQLCQAIGRFCR